MRVFSAILILMLAVALPSLSDAAGPAAGGRTVWLQGYVERTSGSAIQLKGTWYELGKARIVDVRDRPMSSSSIKKGAYFYMGIENGTVTFLRVLQDLGR